MAEDIERAAAVRAINSKRRPENSVAQNRLLALAEHDVFRIPAADVAPVRHGRWVPFHSEAAGDIWYCSACEVGSDWRSGFCPNCGARMDGGVDRAET